MIRVILLAMIVYELLNYDYTLWCRVKRIKNIV